MKEVLKVFNNNKLFLGIMVILVNLGSRHIVDEISASQEEYSRNLMLRRIAVFAMCFVATRDLVTSIMLTAGFVILAMGVSKRAPLEGMTNRKPEEKKDAMSAMLGSASDPLAKPMFLAA